MSLIQKVKLRSINEPANENGYLKTLNEYPSDNKMTSFGNKARALMTVYYMGQSD